MWWADRSPGLTIRPNVIVKHGVVRPREGRQVQGQHLPGAQPMLHAAPAVRFQHRPHAPHQREDVQSLQVLRRDLPALLLRTQETFLLITSFSNQDLALISQWKFKQRSKRDNSSPPPKKNEEKIIKLENKFRTDVWEYKASFWNKFRILLDDCEPAPKWSIQTVACFV